MPVTLSLQDKKLLELAKCVATDPRCTTTLTFDPDAGAFLETVPSLGGTIRNCAGGTTPWGSWLTCEETSEVGPDGTRHGYVFEVPHDGVGTGVALKAMGRFSHEATCMDPSTGIVYLTEDATPSGLYRFLPDSPGDLAAGGRLQMMEIENGGVSYSTYTDPTGTEYRTDWVDIDNPDFAPGELRLAIQGQLKGGAVFRRLEGAWWGNERAYFVSTNGGPAGPGSGLRVRPAQRVHARAHRLAERRGAQQPRQPLRLTPRGHRALRGR